MEIDIIQTLISNFGFPIAVALILLYDKIKTNGSLSKVVETNNKLLIEIKEILKGGLKNGRKQ